MQVNIVIDERTLADAKASIGPQFERRADKAMLTAINKTLVNLQDKIVRAIHKRINLTLKRIRDDVEVVKATPGNLRGFVRVIKQKRPGLIRFGAREQPGQGVMYQIARGGGRKRLPHAFIAPKDGKDHVWERMMIGGRRVGRLPIRRLQGISVWGAFVKNNLANTQFRDAQQTAQQNMNRSVTGILGGFVRSRRAA